MARMKNDPPPLDYGVAGEFRMTNAEAMTKPKCESVSSVQSGASIFVFIRVHSWLMDCSTLQRFFKILDRLLNSLLERHARLPTKDFFRARDIRLAHLRVIHR